MDSFTFLKHPQTCTAENGLKRATVGINIILND